MMKWWNRLVNKPKRAVPVAVKFRVLVRRFVLDPGQYATVGGVYVKNMSTGKLYLTIEADFQRKGTLSSDEVGQQTAIGR